MPYIAFKSPKGLLPYVTVLFWVKEENDENCDVMKQVETMRREVAVDGLQIKFDVDAVLAPTRYVLYLYEKSSGLEFSKAGLSEREEKQFNAILNLILDPRRRKIQQIPVRDPVSRTNRLLSRREKEMTDALNIFFLECFFFFFEGSEFTNKLLQSWLSSRNLHFFTTHNEETKASIVERFNRTIKTRMWRNFCIKKHEEMH